MQLVYDEVEHAAVFRKPLSGLLEEWGILIAHEHDAEHAEVCYQDVRGSILHIPTTTHFAAVNSGEEKRNVRIARLKTVLRSLLCRALHIREACRKFVDFALV